MIDSISISLSGLNASKKQLLTAASNIANLPSSDIIKDSKTISQTPLLADNNSFKISLEKEIISLLTAEIAYKANIFALKTAEEIEQSLINELA